MTKHHNHDLNVILEDAEMALEANRPVAPELLELKKPQSALQQFWFYFRKNKGAVLGLCFIVFIVLVAIFANFIAPHAPAEQFRGSLLMPPVWMEGGSWKFILGTDDVGRDILSRLIYGARLSLLVGVVVVVISLILGITLGLLAGYFGGVIEAVIMRVVNASIALAFVALPHYVRLTRATTLSEMEKDYVVASKVAGAGHFRQMFINILPNCLAPLIVQATLGFSNAILDMAALGFLGMGAQPPTPEWGTMLSDVLQYAQSAWWVVAFPGIAILLTVLAFNLMGDGLRDALDPKLKV